MSATLIVGLVMLAISLATTFMAFVKIRRSKLYAPQTLERQKTFIAGLIVLAAAVNAFGLSVLFIGSAGILEVEAVSQEREMTILAGLILSALGLLGVITLSVTWLITKLKLSRPSSVP